jgi:hypothetical protein
MRRIVNEILHMGSSTTSSISIMEETGISHTVLLTFITYLNGRKYRFCVFTRWEYWSVLKVDLGRAVICTRWETRVSHWNMSGPWEETSIRNPHHKSEIAPGYLLWQRWANLSVHCY